MGRIVVVGSLNMDQTIRVDHLPAAGETVGGGVVTLAPGGKGANQAVFAAAQSDAWGDVVMVGQVGDDDHGRSMVADLDAAGVDVTGVRRVPGGSSGLAMITVDSSGENTIVLSPGVNHAWPTDLGERIRFEPDDVLVCQLEIPLDVVLAAARGAAAAGARVVLNAAPPSALPIELVTSTDVLVLNEHEALSILGAAPATAVELDALCPDLGCAVVVTLGSRGAMVRGLAGPSVAVAAFPVVSASSVGAGDAFVGALAAGLRDGLDLVRAVERASGAGALATTADGARGFVPTRADIDALTGSRAC